MYSHSVLDEIRSRVDLAEFIGSRITLKKAGASYKACCPFHKEKTPSFFVNPVRQSYHCFGCGEHGDIFTFVMKQDGLDFGDAVRLLAERAGVTLAPEKTDFEAIRRKKLYEIHAELAAFYQRCLTETAQAEPARRYLVTRALPDEVVKAFGIGYAPARPKDAILRWAEKHGYTAEDLVEAGVLSPPKFANRPDSFYDRFAGRLMFPITDRQGRVVAFSGRILDVKSHPAKYVNSPETPIFTKGRILYALDKAAQKIVKSPRREAIICEGQIDVIRCHSCGFDTAVASEGTAFTDEHVQLLKRFADCVVLSFDGDAAGRKAALRTGAMFVAAGIPVRVASIPNDDDPDSFLRKFGSAPYREILEGAVSITAYQIETLLKKEENPDSIAAVNRVSKAVLETIALCPGAVQRAKLLEEAAEKLHLPLSALTEDLDRYCAEAKQKAEYAERFRAREKAAEGRAEPPPAEKPAEADAPAEPEPPPGPPPVPAVEFELCEFLVEQEHNDAVIQLFRDYLPAALLRHDFTRTVVGAILGEFPGGEDRLAKLSDQIDPVWADLLGRLIANRQKMLSAQEFTPFDAAHDLIRRFWIDAFQRARDALPAQSPESLVPRLSITTSLGRLRSEPWEQAKSLFTLSAISGGVPPPAAVVRPAAAEPAGEPPAPREAVPADTEPVIPDDPDPDFPLL